MVPSIYGVLIALIRSTPIPRLQSAVRSFLYVHRHQQIALQLTPSSTIACTTSVDASPLSLGYIFVDIYIFFFSNPTTVNFDGLEFIGDIQCLGELSRMVILPESTVHNI